ncbi:hypothetical protein F0726_00127 [Acidithiobacillus caldus]|nr:hypothetical protein F0726_00127 [Acidithiobacillus caldus]
MSIKNYLPTMPPHIIAWLPEPFPAHCGAVLATTYRQQKKARR